MDIPPSTYHTKWKTPKQSVWQAGLEFEISFTWDQSQIPQPVVKLMKQDVSEYATITVDQSRCLIINIDLTTVSSFVCAATPELYLRCTANLSADGRTFNGQITQLCTGTVNYNWQGQCSEMNLRWFNTLNRWIDFALTGKDEY